MLNGVTLIAPPEVPVPLSGTDWGLLDALSVIRRAAERDPAADGLNTTGILVCPPLGPTVSGDAAVGAVKVAGNPKSAGLVPANPSAVI